MLLNPFTPSEIASHPEDFFGRTEELRILERSIMQGSVVIQGGIGIGKSSLLARIRLLMEGFDSSHKSTSVIAVGDKDIETIDGAARLLLEAFVEIDSQQKKVKFKLPKILEIESSEITNYFKTGRHLAALKRILENEYLSRILEGKEFLILAIDEAGKCPIPVARLIRSISTHEQQIGVKNVRFILSGVSPFFKILVSENSGISRFFYKHITLSSMPEEDAVELLETKLNKVVEDAEQKGINLELDSSVINRVVALSGGHPHLLQLLGSHLVERENEDPDGVIDSKDLVNSLHTICYEDREYVYDSSIHKLELHNRLDVFKELLRISNSTFPTRIDRRTAIKITDKESIEWLVEHNFLSVVSSDEYGLMDEFLRVRMTMDEQEVGDEHIIENQMIKQGYPVFDETGSLIDAYYENGEHEDEI